MLDELDEMLAAQREAARNAPRVKVRREQPRHTISYWSAIDQRWKTRTTTCRFRASPRTD
jgi:hypothetical protein